MDNKCFPCRILKGNRIAIPKEIIKELGWKVGDLLIRKQDKKRLYFVRGEVIEV